MGLLNRFRRCIGSSEQSGDTEDELSCLRSCLRIFRKKKYCRVPEQNLNDPIENTIETNTNILEDNGHHSVGREGASELLDHNENAEIQYTNVLSKDSHQKFKVTAEIAVVESSEEMAVPALKKDLIVNNYQPQTKYKPSIEDFTNATVPVSTADECTVDSLYSQVVLTLANYKNMTKFLEPFDEYVSFELSAIRYPDVTNEDLLRTLEYTGQPRVSSTLENTGQPELRWPLTTNTGQPEFRWPLTTNTGPFVVQFPLKANTGPPEIRLPLKANTGPPGVRFPLKANTGPPGVRFPLKANTGPPGVRLPLKTNTGPPGVRFPLKANTGPPGVRFPLKANTGPPGVRFPLKANTGPPGVRFPLKANTGPPGVRFPLKANTGPPEVRLPLKANTGPPGVRLPLKTNTGPPGVRFPLKANTGPPGVRFPLKANTGPPGVRLPLKTNTGPKLGATQNTKPPFPLASTSSQDLQNTKTAASNTDSVQYSSVEWISLTKFEDGGFIINGKVYVPRRHWNCIMGTKKRLNCKVCKVEIVKGNHMKKTEHEDNLKKCEVLADFGLDLIRKVEADCLHCAICNTTMKKADVQHHIVSFKHKNNYSKATKAAELALKKPQKLISLDKFHTVEEGPEYLQIDSILKVHGGIIINRATILKARSWNALTGTNSKRYCNVCQKYADGQNRFMHMFGDEHKENLKKFNYLHDYKEHLIRKLPTEQYHCGICDDVFADPTAHITKVCHRERVAKSSKKVAFILANPTKYTTVEL